MATIAELDKSNILYDSARILTIDAFMDSGAQLLRIARTQFQQDLCGLEVSVLFMRKGETQQDYNRRVDRAVTLGYGGSILSAYVATTISDSPVVQSDGPAEFLNDFLSDIDYTGRDLVSFITSMSIQALRHGKAYALVSFPDKAGFSPASAYEEEVLGLNRPYLVEIPPLSLIDWDTDKFGNLIYAKIKDMRHNRDDTITETWIEIGQTEAIIHELTYPINQRPDGKTPVESRSISRNPKMPFPLIALDFNEIQLGDKLYPIERALMNQQSMRLFYDSLMGFPEKFLKLINADAPPNEGVTTIIKPEEDAMWLETTGAGSESLGKSIKDLREEMYRVANDLSVAGSISPASQQQSGESKTKDQLRAHRICESIGRQMREFVENVLYVIRQNRNENYEDQVSGFQNFSKEYILLLLEVLAGVGSPTAEAEARRRAVRVAMPDLDENTLEEIDSEIQSDTSSSEDVVAEGNPYKIEKHGNEFWVVKIEDGKAVGKHKSKQKAMKQFQALEAAYHKENK